MGQAYAKQYFGVFLMLNQQALMLNQRRVGTNYQGKRMDSLVISNNHPWNFNFLRSIANSTCQSDQAINLINRDSRDLRAEYFLEDNIGAPWNFQNVFISCITMQQAGYRKCVQLA